MAALASAAMPEVQFAGTRRSEQVNNTDTAAGISHAVVQDVSGKLYDIFISSEDKGRKRLHDRARAAWTLQHSKDLAALGFAYDTMLTFIPGKRNETDKAAANNRTNDNGNEDGAAQPMQNMSSLIANDDDDPTILVSEHLEGSARDLRLLTTDDCANVGTAIGAIHRLRPTFITRGKYPAFTTGQIRAQLTGWIKRLRQAGHIPTEITDSWSKVLETEGLWAFDTCPVHGGFVDGDLLFAGSTITAITNWQGMQINDPARDLAWIFAKLNEQRRNAVLSAYGRIMGSRLDSLIMLRANLWLQMEQVGDFLQALQRADTNGIMRFKAQVERLAHELTRISHAQSTKVGNSSANMPASTITVGTLLERDNARNRQAAESAAKNNTGTVQTDETDERDITVENSTSHNNQYASDTTAERNVTLNDDTHERNVQYAGTNVSNVAEAQEAAKLADDTATQVITHIESSHSSHETAETIAQTVTHKAESTSESTENETAQSESSVSKSNVSESSASEVRETENATGANNVTNSNKSYDDKPETVIIPLLEREEQAMKDAQSGLSK